MKDVKTSIRLNEDMLQSLKTIAASKDVSVSHIIREAIKNYLIQEAKDK